MLAKREKREMMLELPSCKTLLMKDKKRISGMKSCSVSGDRKAQSSQFRNFEDSVISSLLS